MTENITLVVMPRDRFSVTENCLENVLKNTPAPFDLWMLCGGAPESARKRWETRYAGRVKFTFFPDFKNGADLRNYAIERVPTKLAAFIDNDVYVRPGWLEPLVRCQRETGAVIVSPLIFDRDNRVHTAGNDFFIVKRNGVTYASMELRYQHHKVNGQPVLERRETAFCEIHCALIDIEAARRMHPFDEKFREFQEMDSGLTLARQGGKMFFEPGSHVYLHYEQRLSKAEDLRFHMWKWDMDAMHEGFEYFKKKWGYDINPENSFENYLISVNKRVGFFSRHWPSEISVRLDRFGYKMGRWSWAGP